MRIRIEFEPTYYTREPDGDRRIDHLDGVVSFYSQEDGDIGRINVKTIDNNISQTPMPNDKALPRFYDRNMSKVVVDLVQCYISALNNQPCYVWTEGL